EEQEESEAEGLNAPVPKVVWKLPPAASLKRSQSREVDPRMIEAGGEVLEATLREFGVDARLVGATVGPTVTRYEVELAPGVKVNKVTSLAKEIAYSMASHDVRILAPIPGRSAIGVEVPNKNRPLVTLGDILATDEAKKATNALDVGMGRDIQGRSVMANLATFPHLLIAGQTGAGKSSCINSIVTSLLMRTTPDQVRLILVDPKRVELGQYNSVPHLLTEVVTNPKKAANALEWAVREMEMRYDLLADAGVRDITGYNAMYDKGTLPTEDDPDPDTGKWYTRLPFIVVVVDELADLMMVAARDVETSICRLAQMARAVGIHLVIATQRPSVDVITGVIKANIPSRLAFSVSTLADSRVILDMMGAEKLIGKGDMLMMTASSSRCERIQGAWVDEECVRKVVAHWRRQTLQPNYIEGVQGDDGPGGSRADAIDDEGDDLLDEAMELIVTSGLGSTSMLQRKLRVGFARAGRIMDLLERRGIVGPSEGSKARAVLMSTEELNEMRERE
ncbi:MAG: DNA translocase FtsK, partial [Actinomycetota bacterium]|nr:DNA translocase FtsK [Actinomycetota bacterium]